MSRRGLTLLLAGFLAVALTASASVARVPYVGLGPGPTYDTLGLVAGAPVISIAGRPTFRTSGQLDLTTVEVLAPLTLFDAVLGWVDPEVAVVPRDRVYPPGKSDEQVQQANAASMDRSQDAATTAALRQLGIPVRTSVVVGAVADGAPASGRLRPGDVVDRVDGASVSDSGALRELVSARVPGQPVRIGYTRAGRAATVTLTTSRAADADRAVIGIEPQDRASYPFEVSIQLKKVGGPSAGLMFALGIVDKLDEQSLTGGRHVAGTGEISADGTVGPIGGIPLKLLGARQKGATVFLTPAKNCREALGAAPAGLQLLSVATLVEALEGLRAVREGAVARTCQDAVAAGS